MVVTDNIVKDMECFCRRACSSVLYWLPVGAPGLLGTTSLDPMQQNQLPSVHRRETAYMDSIIYKMSQSSNSLMIYFFQWDMRYPS